MATGQDMTSYGWAPVGQRLLSEYGNETAPVESAPTMRFAKTWGEIKGMQTMKDLLNLAVDHMRLLHAVDTFPRGMVVKHQLRSLGPFST